MPTTGEGAPRPVSRRTLVAAAVRPVLILAVMLALYVAVPRDGDAVGEVVDRVRGQRQRVEGDRAADLDRAEQQREGERDPQRATGRGAVAVRPVRVAVVRVPVVVRHGRIVSAPPSRPEVSYAAGGFSEPGGQG